MEDTFTFIRFYSSSVLFGENKILKNVPEMSAMYFVTCYVILPSTPTSTKLYFSSQVFRAKFFLCVSTSYNAPYIFLRYLSPLFSHRRKFSRLYLVILVSILVKRPTYNFLSNSGQYLCIFRTSWEILRLKKRAKYGRVSIWCYDFEGYRPANHDVTVSSLVLRYIRRNESCPVLNL